MYLLDTNVLIEAKNRYYAFDIAPGPALGHHQHAVGDQPGRREVVGDEEHRDPQRVPQQADQVEHRTGDLDVKSTGRLVAQQAPTAPRRRPSSRCARPAAARPSATG